MTLARIVSKAVALADGITTRGKLQVNVTRHIYSSVDGDNQATHATSEPLKAFLEEGAKPYRRADGTIVTTEAQLTFLRPTTLDPRDEFTLPSGARWPIVDGIRALVDGSTNAGFYAGVWLGRK